MAMETCNVVNHCKLIHMFISIKRHIQSGKLKLGIGTELTTEFPFFKLLCGH